MYEDVAPAADPRIARTNSWNATPYAIQDATARSVAIQTVDAARGGSSIDFPVTAVAARPRDGSSRGIAMSNAMIATAATTARTGSSMACAPVTRTTPIPAATVTSCMSTEDPAAEIAET